MRILLIILGLIYVLSPYDLLPEIFLGWRGLLDDLILLYFGWRFLQNLRQKQSGAQSFYQQRRQYFEQNKESPGTDFGFKKANTHKDPYTVLNIPRNASREEIKKAYKQLANKYHPDKVLHLGDEFKKLAEERFKEIQEAYRELSSK
ncbi:MAG: DnaJ domain-containing protein [Desulfobacterales bacterium]|jgi:DnaJ-domain-containing protein 1